MTTDPLHDCNICPRLNQFIAGHREQHPDWHNGPVQNFGSYNAPLLIVGLAPGLRGANRTGRPFTGDFAGDLLYLMLGEFGYTRGTYESRADDGLVLTGGLISNAVRCVPPANKPAGAEINNCRPFLTATLAKMTGLKVVLTLGRIGHESFVRGVGERPAAYPFGHGRTHLLPNGVTLVSSYHCSRYNTNTGRLTEQMFRDVFDIIDEKLKMAD